MVSTSFFVFVFIITILSLVFLAIGFTHDIDPLIALGFIGMAITYSFLISVCLHNMWGDAQLWRTKDLNEILNKSTAKKCFNIDGNQLCGDFVYENTKFRYQVSGDTLNILAK